RRSASSSKQTIAGRSSRTTCSTCCPASGSASVRRCERRVGMLACEALGPDGARVDGFSFDGERTVTYNGAQPVDAGIRILLELPPTDDPGWLVPGVFYGENRAEACTVVYPRFTAGRVDIDRMESDAWSFRADRCATPAVFARGGGLMTCEQSAAGQAGVGFAYVDGRPVLRLHFPFREEPLRYDGSETPASADVRTHRWQPGDTAHLTVRVVDDARVLRESVAPAAGTAWVSVEEAADLAAWGLYRWHYRSEERRVGTARSCRRA